VVVLVVVVVNLGGGAVLVVVARGGRLANDSAVGAGFVRSPGARCVETVVILYYEPTFVGMLAAACG